jgi:hypothetical protein
MVENAKPKEEIKSKEEIKEIKPKEEIVKQKIKRRSKTNKEEDYYSKSNISRSIIK